jgi:hypothetical protein
MDNSQFSLLINRFDKSEVFNYLTEVNSILSSSKNGVDYQIFYQQLLDIFEKCRNDGNKVKDAQVIECLNLFKLLSRNLILIFAKLSTKIYDFANKLLNQLNQVSIIILIDLFEIYPNSLVSLLNFSALQIYKLLKKKPLESSNLIYLLNSILKSATKSDIDEKFQSKLLKLVSKSILNTISFDDDSNSTILLRKNYLLCLKNLLILNVSTYYEGLLSTSTTNSSSSNVKPESIMNQQHQFQVTLLQNYDKIILFGLSNQSQEIRIATIELLSHLLINFIPTGKFSGLEYLSDQYYLPEPNKWSINLNVNLDVEDASVENRKLKNTFDHDSESIIRLDNENLLCQTSIIQTLIFYIQLEIFQDHDFLSNNLTTILDIILVKFSEFNKGNHIQNQKWSVIQQHWTTLVDFIVKESGSNCHEILMDYIYAKFNTTSTVELMIVPAKTKKKESVFTFKGKQNQKNRKVTKEIRPYHNSYQAYFLLHIVELLLPFSVTYNLPSQDKQNNGNVEIDSKQLEIKIEDYEEEINIEQNDSFLRDILFKLLINENAYIRNYGLKSLLDYAANNEVEVNHLISKAFNLVKQQLKVTEVDRDTQAQSKTEENFSNSPQVRLFSYSLALAALIKQADFSLLLNATTVKILSFCTQNLKHSNTNNSMNFLVSASCWIILSSLITFYNDSEFVRLSSSQFLVFWKSLLTSQFLSSSGKDVHNQEVLDNLKLRNFSLVCLLNYLNSVDMTPESLKQVQFLLTKSYNYLSYLESNFEEIGQVTNFSPYGFNECNFNFNMINNIHYSNYGYNNKLPFDIQAASTIFYTKKVILQSFVKLAALLKSDINSNIVIFLIRVFSETKVFSRIGDADKSKSSRNKSIVMKVNEVIPNNLILSEDYNYSFGITSKFLGNDSQIDELLIKLPNQPPRSIQNSILFQDTFTKNTISLLKFSKDGGNPKLFTNWLDYFEQAIYKSVHNSINCDPNIYLVQDYSIHEKYAPNLITSLVDLSIELFQLVFPALSEKIQFSLLEQIRNSLTTKGTDKLRHMAVEVNVSIALNGMLNLYKRKNLSMEKEQLQVVSDIISKIESRNEHIVEINSDTIGVYNDQLKRRADDLEVKNFIQNIINDPNPYNRGYAILSLAKIYKETQTSFNEVFNVASQLLNDPNPIVYHYALKSMDVLFQSNLDNMCYIPDLLQTLHTNFLNDEFGHDIANHSLVNLKCKYSSVDIVSRIVKTFITSLGPSLKECSSSTRSKLRTLLISFTHGIGLATTKEYLQVYGNLLMLFQELIIFDSKLINEEVDFFANLLNLIISKNLKIGLVSVSPTSLNRDSIFPFTSSFDLYKAAYDCYVELIKIFGTNLLTKETLSMLWVSMNLRPCPELKDFIQFWLESSLELNWFITLNSLFKFSAKKLIAPYIETNYQQKLLPLLQRQKKKQKSNVDFKDEEIASIVADDADHYEKVESITWEFKLFIYDLLNHLLTLANKNQQLVQTLKQKIPDLVKISFLGSTSPITEIKISGINLLNKVLGLFGHAVDPQYPGTSILEQQQAQIISALIPCFNSDSNAAVIVNAINVSSKFINLPRVKFYSKQRLLNTLIYLLEEISSTKFLKFVYLENMSEYKRKSIQLSILNCWALLKVDAWSNEDETEEELLLTLDKYSKLLLPLWILVLREFSLMKYNETSTKEIEIYSDYWINFIRVLNIELQSNQENVNKYLSGDSQNFFFVLFSQCIESLIKNKNVSEILITLNRLLNSSDLVELLFDDGIFGEIVDLFDRLILIDNETEIQCELIDIISTIFHTHLRKHLLSLETGFDKLFELIRMAMLPLFNILPFLKTDFDENNPTHQFHLKKADSASNLLVLKKTLQLLIGMVESLPDAVRADMYACLLFVFSKIYQFQNELLISVTLPFLKQIITGSNKLDLVLVETFSAVIGGLYRISSEKSYTVVTAVILHTDGNISLNEQESIDLSHALIDLLTSDTSGQISIQCIKSLIQSSSDNKNLPLKFLIGEILMKLTSKDKFAGDPKVAFEILFLFSKTISNETKLTALYSILIPVLINFNENDQISKSYLHERLLLLINQSPLSFKAVVNSKLSRSQKQLTENLVKLNPQDTSTDELVNEEPEIELKTFGN